MERRNFFLLLVALLAAPFVKKTTSEIPSGYRMQFAGSEIPPGWVRCEGQTISDPGHSHNFPPGLIRKL